MRDENHLDNLSNLSIPHLQNLGDPHELQTESPTIASILAMSKNEEALKLAVPQLEGLSSDFDPLSISSPILLSTPKLPALEPSPSFDSKASSKAMLPDSEKKYLRPEEKNEPMLHCEIGSVESSCSEVKDTLISNQNHSFLPRTNSTPPTSPTPKNRLPPHMRTTPKQFIPRRKYVTSIGRPSGGRPEAFDLKYNSRKRIGSNKSESPSSSSSSIPIPIPPMSLPTYLQLELSTTGPSPLYIHRSSSNQSSFESSRIKFQRLLNFMILPPELEKILIFGLFTCLDAWLHTFTILPLRFFKAAGIFSQWWSQVMTREINFISGFIYHGSGRMWNRQCERSVSLSRSRTGTGSFRPDLSALSSSTPNASHTPEISDHDKSNENRKTIDDSRSRRGRGRKHYIKLQPTSLSSRDKADLIQGAIIIFSCIILMKLDASRMYHYIRGQAAIKLYVIFNVLEVGDKLLAAIGQDIFECLFSDEILKPVDNSRKNLQPFWMFLMALIYNVIHAAALFFQVITLNVAVNSYSNALFTLLMSNQFVEIKSTVFKKIEKDNLFQLTCADVVERFQLCIILLIIALRNIVEMGGLSMPSSDMSDEGGLLKGTTTILRGNSFLPNSFSILPSWSGEVLSPFFFVLGSEMLVDWIKHSYISKFNNVKPTIYAHYLDILAKDYYSNAFMNQNIVKRLGLPVIPLACLFIRSSVQTYHMFLATYLPPPKPSSATELSVESATSSPATTAALEHFDTIIRHALGRSTHGVPDPRVLSSWYLPRTDDIIAALTMVVFFLVAFFVLLVFKLALGMVLLRYARNRYQCMKMREHRIHDTDGKRIGAWGMTEVDEEKKRWIYQDDQDEFKKLKEKQEAAKEKASAPHDFGKISRYEMLKRIW